MEFKSSEAQELVEALMSARPAFEERNKGREWKGMMMTVAFSFPEDRGRIYAIFGKEKGGDKSGGHGKLIRPKVKTGLKMNSGGCDTCPDDVVAVEGGSDAKSPRVLKGGGDEWLKDEKEVLDKFEGDIDLMKIYAKKKGVDIGKASTAEGIAKKIAEHYKGEG